MKNLETTFLKVRNITVVFASIFWLVSFKESPHEHLLRGIGYIFGAIAYLSELIMMTDGLKKFDHKELFMAYCFFPVYILKAMSYLGVF